MLLALLFTTTSAGLSLPTGLLDAVCYVESKHDIKAISYYDGKTHSYGVCQIKYETAKSLGFKGTIKDLMLPKNNVMYAGKYLQKQILRYNSISKGVVAYNRGNAAKIKTSAYQQKVFKQWRIPAYAKR